MTEKVIKDIRYFESNWENKDYSSIHSYIGSIFKVPNDVTAIGQRIARKLNQLNFVSGVYDHLYINFTTCLKEGEMNISQRNVENWLVFIDYGLNTDAVNMLSDPEKSKLIQGLTFKIIKKLFSYDINRLKIIDSVESEIEKFASEMEIVYKTKETKSYKVVLSYQIRPNNSKSCAILEYWGKLQNIYFKKKIFELEFFDDIYPLVDTISVKDGYIVFKPKKSYIAEVYNKRYKTPIKINIADFIENGK